MSIPQCKALSAVLGDKLSYPKDSIYSQSVDSYWSQQEAQVAPDCILTPKSTQDVAVAIKILSHLHTSTENGASFAVRGGGHTPFAGSANINSGVTIDLRSIKGIEISSDQGITSIGGGAIWRDVYQKLVPKSLMVVGGRVSNVGVGGLTLGGGISFWSPRKGFVCDNILNYEVVLADGSIINANAEEHADLWLALKGGSSNFGIVTRFDIRTFPQGDIWGGTIIYDISTAALQFEAFSNFISSNDYDEYAELIQNYAFIGRTGFQFAVNSIEYTKPVENPLVFQPFTKIQSQFSNSMRITNLTDITDEQASSGPKGARQIFMTTTFKNDLSLLNAVVDMWKDSTRQVKSIVEIVYAVTFQVLPPAITSKSSSLGGNSLGLDPSDGPLVLCLVTLTWNSSADDAAVSQAGRRLIGRIDQAAQTRGLFNRFKYLNYAHVDQNPFAGYGSDTLARLKAVARKYDPSGLFTQAMSGGFKVLDA